MVPGRCAKISLVGRRSTDLLIPCVLSFKKLNFNSSKMESKLLKNSNHGCQIDVCLKQTPAVNMVCKIYSGNKA